MASDTYTEVTRESWFGRIGNSIKGILFGIILVIASIALLFWNEGRAVKTAKSLDEGSKTAVSISSDKVDSANEGRLVHMTGMAKTNDLLKDDKFGISKNAIKLKRKVEMYQWKEEKESTTKKKVGGGSETTTTYKYERDWSESLIKSSNFKKPEGHDNPDYMPYKTEVFTAENVKIGDFKLSEGLVQKINNFENLPVDKSNLAKDLQEKVKVVNEMFYIGADPSYPKVGDIRIAYQVVEPSTVSIVSQQSSSSFKPYLTKVGRKLELLNIGSLSAEEMFQKAKTENKILTWVLRLVGFILMYIGFSMIFGPLSVMADVLPILGSIVGFGTGVISFILSFAISLITIAIGWVFYRPILGIGLIVVALIPIIGLIILKPKKKK